MPRTAPMLTAMGLALALPVAWIANGDAEEWKGPPGTATPNLTSASGGRLILTWLEPAGTGRHALRFAVRERGRWSSPGTIRESDRFFVNWADFASLAETGDGRLVAHWLEKVAPTAYAYHVMLSVSSDRGRSWSAPIRAHEDSTATEHGFVGMTPSANGVDLVWLDGREMAGKERGEMGIRTRHLGPGNVLSPEVLLDSRTCECCQAAIARTSSGLVAAYRDRSESEVRDIAVVRHTDGRWTEPKVAAADGWEHRACPVNGPALVAEGRQVDLVWYTGVSGEPRVWLTRSSDAGLTFAPRVRIDEGRTLGRVDAVPMGDGRLLVAWLETRSEQEAEWRVRMVDAAGRPGKSRSVAVVSRARLAGFPRLARTPDGVFLSYTATGPDGGVRVVRLEEGGRRR